jgi:hypothetical protein
MIWGVVGIFVMATVWGLVAFLAEELGIDDAKSSMTVPTIETTTP